MSRRARIVVAGYPHHVVQRGNNHQLVFYDDNDRRLYLNLLRNYSLECNCKIRAYCLMSNHIHILLVPQADLSLARMMQKLSLCYTQYINKKYERTGRLWECRFHSTVVDNETYLWTVCRYIERNPVRAKIVDKPNQYQWSSADINTKGQKSDFIESIWHNSDDREAYIEFLNRADDETEVEMITKFTYGGKPIGTEKFTTWIVNELGIDVNRRSRGRPLKK